MSLETTLLVKILFNKDRTPLDTDNFNKVHRVVGESIEKVEERFGIEFSCGDGKYPSLVTDSELSKYDGKVSFDFPPRLEGKQKPLPEELVFRVQEHTKTGETRCQVGVQTRTHVKWLS